MKFEGALPGDDITFATARIGVRVYPMYRDDRGDLRFEPRYAVRLVASQVGDITDIAAALTDDMSEEDLTSVDVVEFLVSMGVTADEFVELTNRPEFDELTWSVEAS